jgi:16S rRNA (guanine527-N7)-methyltransferase
MSIAALFSAHGFELSDSEILQFETLLDRFVAYNSHTNLSAIRDEEGIIVKHFIDSLYGSLAYEMHGRLLDIGSGGGFPGIPLKIIHSDLEITLLDSVGKKVKAMNHFVVEL